MNEINLKAIPKEKLRLVEGERSIHDIKLETKPIGYLKDALIRFRKNKGSVLAFFIIVFLFLYAIIVPFVSPYDVSFRDIYYAKVLPRSELSLAIGWDFWDGCEEMTGLTKGTFQYYYALTAETKGQRNSIKDAELNMDLSTFVDGEYDYFSVKMDNSNTQRFSFRLDSYEKVGMIFMNLTPTQYIKLQSYQDEYNVQVIYPMTEKEERPFLNFGNIKQYSTNANYWYKFDGEEGEYPDPILDENGQLQNIYLPYYNASMNPPEDLYTSVMRVENEVNEDGTVKINYQYRYANTNQTGYEVRVNYYEFFKYQHVTANNGAGDGIEEPSFFFGTTTQGQDIFVSLASGALFSIMLAIFVSVINLTLGSIYGAIEGYYGGVIDLAMERFSDILSCVPFMIVLTLFKLHLSEQVGIVGCLLVAYVLTGWIGMAARVRMQFYRFKNSEYVLAARTLGASDGRIMFKHIFPNSLGTLITGCVLVIPGVIFSESSLSYLGIINLSNGDMTSVGTLLAEGQPYLMSYPHMILFPSIFISLLMLSFNLFGNGLRDAFNPSLRGAEG